MIGSCREESDKATADTAEYQGPQGDQTCKMILVIAHSQCEKGRITLNGQ